jgi:hypothetical protein
LSCYKHYRKKAMCLAFFTLHNSFVGKMQYV